MKPKAIENKAHWIRGVQAPQVVELLVLKQANAGGVRGDLLSASRATPRAAEPPRPERRFRVVSCFMSDSVALSAVQGENGPEHPDSGFKALPSATQRLAKLIEQAEEHMLPGIPRQQPIDDPPSRREDLRRNPHHRLPKRAEVHPQQFPFLLPTLLPPASPTRAASTGMPQGNIRRFMATTPSFLRSEAPPASRQICARHRRRRRSP